MKKLYLRVIDHAHIVYALYGRARYGRLYRPLTVIAVTGTDGKSSTVVLTARLLRKAGLQVAHYSSITMSDSVKEEVNVHKMTTPGRAGLQRFLAQAAVIGVTHAIVEITSEGIRQWRQVGIKFDCVVYTNITPEHIERHGSFTNYKQTKLSLLSSLKESGVVVWNQSDPELRSEEGRFATYHNVPVITDDGVVGRQNPFVHRNYTLVKAVAKECGVEVELSETEKELPGRFEILHDTPTVIVDYAHTPAAVELCLKAAKKMCKGKLIHVFGAAGGGRDTQKRPLLAKLSEQYASVHILTEENSFDEPVLDIMHDIKQGFSSSATVYIEPCREDAIQKACLLANPTDVIICTAKGSEVVIAGPKGSKRPYNEREFVTQCIQSKLN